MTFQLPQIGFEQWSAGAGNSWSGPASGLTHRWPMDDANVSGNTITDVVGSLHGTGNSGVSSTTGPVTQARLFDGITGFVNLASCPVSSLASAYTLGVFVKILDITADDGNGNDVSICGMFDGSYSLRTGNANTSAAGKFYGLTSNFDQRSGSIVFVNNTWVHVCMTYDGSGLAGGYKLYKNGSVDAFNGGATGDGLGNGNGFGGRAPAERLGHLALYQFVTYNRALSSGEVSQLYGSN